MPTTTPAAAVIATAEGSESQNGSPKLSDRMAEE